MRAERCKIKLKTCCPIGSMLCVIFLCRDQQPYVFQISRTALLSLQPLAALLVLLVAIAFILSVVRGTMASNMHRCTYNILKILTAEPHPFSFYNKATVMTFRVRGTVDQNEHPALIQI